jgi:hypothetical protein
MLIGDTITRWNSSYLSISRALKLRDSIEALQIKFASELDEDALISQDWVILEQIVEVLRPFASITKMLEGNASNGLHGSIWEALPALEALIKHMDKMKLKYTQELHPQLATSINLAWSKLDEYYSKLDNTPAYTASLTLHPQFRLDYFVERWTGSLKKYLGPTKKAMRELYLRQYKHLSTPIESEQPEVECLDRPAEYEFFDSYVQSVLPTTIEDEYFEYINGQRLKHPPENLFHWWAQQSDIPSMQQMAYDLLSIPAMSSETERIFSDSKLYLSPQRCRMGAELLEALECENKWIKAGI